MPTIMVDVVSEHVPNKMPDKPWVRKRIRFHHIPNQGHFLQLSGKSHIRIVVAEVHHIEHDGSCYIRAFCEPDIIDQLLSLEDGWSCPV
jgi:hypothetical protein